MSLLRTVKFSEINNIYPIKEKIIDLLMINGGEIILKDNKKFKYLGKKDEYHFVKKIFLTDPDYPKIRVIFNEKIYNFVPYNIIEWEKETGKKVIYPLINTESYIIKDDSENANLWYKMDQKGTPLSTKSGKDKKLEFLFLQRL